MTNMNCNLETGNDEFNQALSLIIASMYQPVQGWDGDAREFVETNDWNIGGALKGILGQVCVALTRGRLHADMEIDLFGDIIEAIDLKDTREIPANQARYFVQKYRDAETASLVLDERLAVARQRYEEVTDAAFDWDVQPSDWKVEQITKQRARYSYLTGEVVEGHEPLEESMLDLASIAKSRKAAAKAKPKAQAKAKAKVKA